MEVLFWIIPENLYKVFGKDCCLREVASFLPSQVRCPTFSCLSSEFKAAVFSCRMEEVLFICSSNSLFFDASIWNLFLSSWRASTSAAWSISSRSYLACASPASFVWGDDNNKLLSPHQFKLLSHSCQVWCFECVKEPAVGCPVWPSAQV